MNHDASPSAAPVISAKSLSQQQGMGLVGWLITVAIVGMVLAQIFKLMPPYVESYSLGQELQKMAELDGGVESLSNRQINERLSNFFRVNRVSTPATKSLSLTRDGENVTIDMEYRVEVPLFYNITAVLDFHKHLNSRFPDQCCDARD